ncbi:MAG: hypothetical protein R6V46_18345 [Desulfatiglandaceae bacterium]
MDRRFDIEEKVNDFLELHKEKVELEARIHEIDSELSNSLGRLVENQPHDFVAELSSYLKNKRHVLGGCRGYSELLLLAEKKTS